MSSPEATELASGGYLSVKEAAELAAVSKRELYRRMGAGELAYAQIGRRRVIPRLDLERFLAERTVVPVRD